MLPRYEDHLRALQKAINANDERNDTVAMKTVKKQELHLKKCKLTSRGFSK